ncbi:hypothetical protein [Pseudomonas fluorescens]|uniref:hypothetical protein n=1 Tax=Pseudomonas fluorescens TaxID=294 RepID=UPI003CFE1D28
MSLNTADKIFLAVGPVDFAGIFIWIGVALYIAYTKATFLLNPFKNSPFIINLTPLRHGGPWRKLLLVGSISGIVTFPSFYIKRGTINPEDTNNFPSQLKLKLVIFHWIGLALLFVMFGIGAVAEFDLL